MFNGNLTINIEDGVSTESRIVAALKQNPNEKDPRPYPQIEYVKDIDEVFDKINQAYLTIKHVLCLMLERC